jgi:hypothetical protein
MQLRNIIVDQCMCQTHAVHVFKYIDGTYIVKRLGKRMSCFPRNMIPEREFSTETRRMKRSWVEISRAGERLQNYNLLPGHDHVAPPKKA